MFGIDRKSDISQLRNRKRRPVCGNESMFHFRLQIPYKPYKFGLKKIIEIFIVAVAPYQSADRKADLIMNTELTHKRNRNPTSGKQRECAKSVTRSHLRCLPASMRNENMFSFQTFSPQFISKTNIIFFHVEYQ